MIASPRRFVGPLMDDARAEYWRSPFPQGALAKDLVDQSIGAHQ